MCGADHSRIWTRESAGNTPRIIDRAARPAVAGVRCEGRAGIPAILGVVGEMGTGAEQARQQACAMSNHTQRLPAFHDAHQLERSVTCSLGHQIASQCRSISGSLTKRKRCLAAAVPPQVHRRKQVRFSQHNTAPHEHPRHGADPPAGERPVPELVQVNQPRGLFRFSFAPQTSSSLFSSSAAAAARRNYTIR